MKVKMIDATACEERARALLCCVWSERGCATKIMCTKYGKSQALSACGHYSQTTVPAGASIDGIGVFSSLLQCNSGK